MTHARRAEVIPLYHVPRSQVWEGSRGRQTGRVHLHVNGRALCGVRSPWYPRDPLAGEERCARCVARADREGINWPLTAGDQGERPDGTGRVAPADGCAERQSTDDPSPAASAGPDTPADSQEATQAEVVERLVPKHVRDAIGYAEEGRASHVAWAEHLDAGTCEFCTNDVVDTAGDAAHQREWVAKYDAILAVLREYADRVAASRLLDSIARISDEVNHERRVAAVQHALRYRAEAAHLLSLLDTPADSPEPREGIVMVYDWQHRYLGCMGIERWQEVLAADSQEDEWFIPEGDRRCGVVHMHARATCMKRRGHGGSHGTAQGTWIDGPWCEYPADSQEDKT